MAEKITTEITHMLNEEKWTRRTLSDFAISHFKELDVILDAVVVGNAQNDILEINKEHLEQNKNSIIALYFSGVISLSKQQIDDSHLFDLIDMFTGQKKWVVVEYLCRRILDFRENKEALRKLAIALENLQQADALIAVWERLVKIDYAEADIVRQLAEQYEEKEEKESAILYYRKAVHRYVNKNLFNQVRNIWQKLIALGVDDYDFFFLIGKKVAKIMSVERAIELFEILYPAIKEREQWPTAIVVLKMILNYDVHNNWARNEIIECYAKHYAGHSHLDQYISLSNLNQNWRNVLEAIADFEKHISFDAGNFVFHKTWGVGIIKELVNNQLVIDFAKRRTHSMSLKMGIGALQSLTREHIWVLKSIHSKEKLKAKVKSDILWTLKTIIRSFDNVSDMKKVKAELVPTVLSVNEWTNWSAEARKILKTNLSFSNVPDQIDSYVLRDNPMSFEEKTYNQFKAENKFFKKIETSRHFLDHSDPDSEFFVEIFQYFTGFLKTGNVTVQVLGSYLFVMQLGDVYPFLAPQLDWGFKELWDDIDNTVEIFSQLEDNALRQDFLACVRRDVENWQIIYLTLFPYHHSQNILDELLNAGFKDLVFDKLDTIINHYRDYRETLIWLARHAAEHVLLNEIGLKYEKIIINMIHLLRLSFSDSQKKNNALFNRKIHRQVEIFLFKEKRLEEFIVSSNKDSVLRLFSLLESTPHIDFKIIDELKEKAKETFPRIRFHNERKSSEPIQQKKTNNFYTTKTSLDAKKKLLKTIINVEIPKNSKEIGVAIELGDLSENAEYKAGKEKQEELQIRAGRLKDDIERARIFSEEGQKKETIRFGTIITLIDNKKDQEETYTILGPWESDPSEGIISYISPFGDAFMGHKKGEKLQFTINDREYDFSIKEVEFIDLI